MRRMLTALVSTSLLAGSVVLTVPAAQAVPPTVGGCYDYSIGEAAGLNNAAAPVSCKGGHTAETFYVGAFSDSMGDPNKASEGTRLSLTNKKCGVEALNTWLGMPDRTLPSRFAVFSYWPTTAEWKAGERWFRCDVVLREGTGLKEVSGSLANTGDVPKYDYCTPGAIPNWKKLEAKACNTNATAKSWILVDRPVLGGPTSGYPSGISNKAQAKCKAMQDLYPGLEKAPRYYYTFPGSLEWTAGARTSNCFIPLQQYLDSKNPGTSTQANVGDCFDYTLASAYKLVQTAKQVACTDPHTAQTFLVPALPEYVGDPTKATEGQRQTAIQENCTRATLLEFLGVSETTPMRFDIFGFFPGSGDFANGVRTFHCDVVFLDGKGLAKLTQPMPTFAQSAGPVDLQYCTKSIGYANTPNDSYQSAVSCNQTKVKKYWIEARAAELSSSKPTPSTKTIGKITKQMCASVKTEFAGGKKKPSWYYTYPDSNGWANGNRTGRCWVPLEQYQQTTPPAPVDPSTTPVA